MAGSGAVGEIVPVSGVRPARLCRQAGGSIARVAVQIVFHASNGNFVAGDSGAGCAWAIDSLSCARFSAAIHRKAAVISVKKTAKKLDSRALVKLCRTVAEDKKAEKCVIFDVREISSIADYFLPWHWH